MITRVYDNYSGDIRYIDITEAQKRLLDWMLEAEIIREGVEFEVNNLPKVETI